MLVVLVVEQAALVQQERKVKAAQAAQVVQLAQVALVGKLSAVITTSLVGCKG